MKKLLEKLKEKRLRIESWVKDNKGKPITFFMRLIPLILFVAIVVGRGCQDKKTAFAEPSSNGFTVQLPTLVSSFHSYTSSDDLPLYVYGYNTAYNIKVNFLTSPSGVKHIYFTTSGGDGNIFSPSFTVVEGVTTYRFYNVYTSTSPYINSTFFYADNIFASDFALIRPLALTFDCVDVNSVSQRFAEITPARFNSPYNLSTLSFYRVILRGDYGENRNRTWYLEVFCPIQIEDYALFGDNTPLVVDLSNSAANQYELGYSAGLSASQTEAFNRGYDSGYAVGDQNGYSRGIEDQLSDVSPLRVVFNSISDILKLEIVPYVKLGYLLTLVVGVLAISLVFKRG